MSSTIVRYHRVADPLQPESRGVPVGVAMAKVLPDGDVAVGFSRCSEGDTFDRHRGRMIAEGRLDSNKFVAVSEDNHATDIFCRDTGRDIDLVFSDMHSTIDWVVQEALRREAKNSV